MKLRTEYFGAKVYPPDAAKMRELRAQLQARNPDRAVVMADAFALAVGSLSAALAAEPKAPDRPG